MKKLFLLLTALATGIACCPAARLHPTTGRVVDEQGGNVEFASVILLHGGEQAAGTATDTEGRFTLKVPSGDYTLSIQYLGYEPLKREIRIGEELQLGDFTLRPSARKIEGIVVRGQLIRREADRFVVNVANAPSAIGRNGIELLEHAPGVWLDNDKITINGKSGSKVYINDRQLRMEATQLMTYLRSLHAEEIRKIEVIPTTGADYDADSAGGIIKITLRKRRENGVEGSVTMTTYQSGLQHSYSPGGSISYHTGRLDLNASAWSWLGNTIMISEESTSYTGSDKRLRAHSKMDENDYTGGGTIEAVYEIGSRHSIGAEFSFLHMNEENENPTATDLIAGTTTRTASDYNGSNRATGFEGTFNYIWKIDTLGSTFKLLGDYAHRTTRIRSDNFSRITAPAPAPVIDSSYRDHTLSKYCVAALTLALEKNFSPRWSLKTGMKYTRNDMRNDARYEYRRDDRWAPDDNQSFAINYTEHIAAAYGIVSAKFGRLNFIAGLRGEYTRTYGRGEKMGRNYFSLFPNANISWSLDGEGAYSVVAQYGRTIERPQFWVMTPRRMQISDYTYQTGNPELDPAYKHDVSLTLVMKHKYTLTGGVIIQTGEIQQTMVPDGDNPDRLCLTWLNFATTKNYYVTANLPFQFTKWWSLNVNASYVRQGQRIDRHSPEQHYNICSVNSSTTFTLPAKCYIDLSYRFQSRMNFGNCWVEPMHFLHAGLKKRFGERFTASFTVRNLLDRTQHIGARGEGFVRTVDNRQPWVKRSCQIGLTYNFKAGKAFKKRSVEAGAADDKGRL